MVALVYHRYLDRGVGKGPGRGQSAKTCSDNDDTGDGCRNRGPRLAYYGVRLDAGFRVFACSA